MFELREYKKAYNERLIEFLEKCLPESGRKLELCGRHQIYYDVESYFENFWCMFDGKNIIGTVALKKLDEKQCELKSLYLLKQYQGRRLGLKLLDTAISKAKERGCISIYLDTLSSSVSAVRLYEKAGFVKIERYNDNLMADVFMRLDLNFSKDGI